MDLNKDKGQLVWTGFVRITHWLVAICVMLNFFNDTGYWHRVIGYAVLLLVLLRITYGLFSYQQSSNFYIPRLRHIKMHLNEMQSQYVRPHTGHNPLGQYAVYVMWLLISLLAATGWLSRTDEYWGEEWPVDLHMFFSNILATFVIFHLIAIVIMSKLQRKSLAKEMITGKSSSYKT